MEAQTYELLGFLTEMAMVNQFLKLNFNTPHGSTVPNVF